MDLNRANYKYPHRIVPKLFALETCCEKQGGTDVGRVRLCRP